MAILTLENQTTYTKLEEIVPILSQLDVQLNYWTIGDKAGELLAKDVLNEEEKEQVLQSVDHYFEQLKTTQGYQSRDLIVLYPHLDNLSTLLNKFAACHTHADDEVRYIIDGEAVFGFVLPDGSQIELTIQPQEYINVPANTEHWFHLTSSKRVKAVRYFTNNAGWVPVYTGTVIRFPALITA